MDASAPQPTEQPADQSKPEPAGFVPVASPRKRRPRSPSSPWAQARRDVVIGAIAVAAAAVSGVLGVADISWLWLLLAGAGIAAIAVCVTHALSARHASMKAWWWRTSLLAALLLPLGVFTYHQWFDPAARVPKTYDFVVNGSETRVVPLFGEAGGPEQLIETGQLGQRGLIGGQTYPFDCRLTGRDGAEWLKYRRFGRVWYAPRVELHPPVGVPQPAIPHC